MDVKPTMVAYQAVWEGHLYVRDMFHIQCMAFPHGDKSSETHTYLEQILDFAILDSSGKLEATEFWRFVNKIPNKVMLVRLVPKEEYTRIYNALYHYLYKQGTCLLLSKINMDVREICVIPDSIPDSVTGIRQDLKVKECNTLIGVIIMIDERDKPGVNSPELHYFSHQLIPTFKVDFSDSPTTYENETMDQHTIKQHINPDISQQAISQQDISQQDILQQDISQQDISQKDISQQDISHQDLSQQDISHQDISQQDILQQDISQQDISQQDISQQDISQQDISQQDISQQDILQQDISQQDISQQDISQQNISHQDISQQDISHQDISQQDISHENISQQDISQQDISHQDISQQDISHQDISEQNISHISHQNKSQDRSNRNRSHRNKSQRVKSHQDIKHRNKSQRDRSHQNKTQKDKCSITLKNITPFEKKQCDRKRQVRVQQRKPQENTRQMEKTKNNKTLPKSGKSCRFCHETFVHYSTRRNHELAKHKEIKNYKCTKCPATFVTSFNCKRHMNTHITQQHASRSDINPKVNGQRSTFRCNQCNKTFRAKQNLKQHLICKHSSGKLFECSTCSKQFKYKSTKSKHEIKCNV